MEELEGRVLELEAKNMALNDKVTNLERQLCDPLEDDFAAKIDAEIKRVQFTLPWNQNGKES